MPGSTVMTTAETTSTDVTTMSFEEVFKMSEKRTREGANTWLTDHVPRMRGAEWDKFRRAREEELRHIRHVRHVMQAVTGVSNNHDFSKDEWYMMVTIGRFTMDQADLTEQVFTKVVQEHYLLEPHHPEHEGLPGCQQCTTQDIMEMAVDRLSRNLQKNQGEYNWQQMGKYEPVFTYDVERKLELYRKSTKEYAEITEQIWKEMVPE